MCSNVLVSYIFFLIVTLYNPIHIHTIYQHADRFFNSPYYIILLLGIYFSYVIILLLCLVLRTYGEKINNLNIVLRLFIIYIRILFGIFSRMPLDVSHAVYKYIILCACKI